MRMILRAAVVPLMLAAYAGSYVTVSAYAPFRCDGGPYRTFPSRWVRDLYSPMVAVEAAIRGQHVDACIRD